MTVNILDRKVNLPDYTVCKGDKKAQTFNFAIDKTLNGTDLSLCNCFIKTLREDGFSDKVKLTAVAEGDKLYVSWQPDENDTAVEGGLKCQLSFENAEGFTANTETFIIDVKESVSGYESMESGYIHSVSVFSDFFTTTEADARFKQVTDLIPLSTSTENQLADKNYVADSITAASAHYNDYALTEIARQTEITYSYTATEDNAAEEGKDYFLREGEEGEYTYTISVAKEDYDAENPATVSGLYEKNVDTITYKYSPQQGGCYYIAGSVTDGFTIEFPAPQCGLMNEIYLEFTTGDTVSVDWGENCLFLNNDIPTIKASRTYEIIATYSFSASKWCVSVVENGTGEV